jgi:cyclopropane-fatty-acyl-phospholipid synthase
MRLANRLLHLLRRNSRRGARKNIEAHYDLGNDFYRLWLDPSMLYSSAIWTPETETLEQAQRYRLNRITQTLGLSGGESILEIGCGWGALAEHLAVTADAHVTGITLSPSQLKFAQDVAARCGKGENIELRIQDYRDVEETYDRIVSIEMFEAVGEAYWPSYFDTIRRCLKPGGSALLQIITIEERRFHAYRDNVDFIQRYVFPGGFLPSETALRAAIEKSGLVLSDTEHFGESYALTLADWRRRFRAAWPAIAALGFDQRFQRLWEYYLCYCEAGFAESSINVGFYVVRNPDA